MVPFLVNSLVLASLYALLGVGFVVLYRASRIINLAHGELMMLGGFFTFVIASVIPGQAILAIAGALFLAAFLGAFIYLVLLRPMIGQPIVSAIMVTIGISILLRGLATLAWGPRMRSLNVALGIRNLPHLLPGGITISTFELATIVVAIVFLGGLLLFFKYVRQGIQMRAVAENALLASQRGINIFLVFVLAWIIAILSSTAAGILYSSNVRLDPEIGFIGLKALAVPIVGGMDSLVGLIPAALTIALLEIAFLTFISSQVSESVPLIILLIVLLIRPWGLFGTKEEIERV